MAPTRRELLTRLGAAAAGLALSPSVVPACSGGATGVSSSIGPAAEPRVAIARDDVLLKGKNDDHRVVLEKILDASLQKLTGENDAARAWSRFFTSTDRVGIKVNTLGLSTNPVVVDAIVAGLLKAGLQEERILIWDRFDVELKRAGFVLNRSGVGVQCRGTDAKRVGSGYQPNIEVSGQIGSCYSRIVAEEVDALISVPVLKDHNLAGVSLGMKNFYGAIHNPNKYHDDHCDPYIADVVAHPFIAPKWRLTICDGTRAQFHNGPGKAPGYEWPFAGVLVSGDFVAADAVGAALLESERADKGHKSLAEEDCPTRHIATAGARGLGESNLTRIEQIEV